MRQSDRKDFVIALLPLASMFRIEFTEAVLEAYWSAMSDLSIEALRGSVVMALRSCRFMPSAAELREFAGGPGSAFLAERTWSTIRESIGRVGRYESVDFGPVANAALRAAGGWVAICTADPKELTWLKKEFVRLYLAYFKQSPTPKEGAYLSGVFGGDPTRIEFAPPLCIGIEDRPRLPSGDDGPDPEDA